MSVKKVRDILVRYQPGAALHPHLAPNDSLTRAVEVMGRGQLTRVAVLHGGRPLGMVLLDDAFRELGLQHRADRGRHPS